MNQVIELSGKVFDWFKANPGVVGIVVFGSILFAIVSAALVVVAISRMSPDYFVSTTPPVTSWRRRHPALRMMFAILKSVLGLALLLAGIAMLFVPGQGLLTILIGITLLEFPGKRNLERRIVRERHILNAMNWIRAKHDQPPLKAPEHNTSRGQELN